MKKIGITGSRGFLGCHLVNALKSKIQIQEIDKELGFNLLEKKWWTNLSATPDIIIHLAAIVPNGNSEDFNRNIEMTNSVIAYAKSFEVKKVVYFNTYVYGNAEYLPVDESHKVAAISDYHKSKIECENLLFEKLGIKKVISLRLFNLYGVGQKEPFIIPHIFNCIRSNNKIDINDPSARRDFINVKDVVKLVEKIIDIDEISGVFNVGTGHSVSMLQVAKLINNIFEEKYVIEIKNRKRKNEINDNYADISKITTLTGWRPEIKFEDGLREIKESLFH